MRKRVHWLFFSFFCILIIQTLGSFLYLHYQRSTLQQSFQSDTIQEIMNVVHMVKATPTSQLPRAIKSLEMPHLYVTLTNIPAYEKQATQLSTRILRSLIHKDSPTLTVSLSVPNDQWVNIRATFDQSPAIWPHLLLLLGELIVASIVLFYAWSINRFIEPLKDFQKVAEGLGINLKATPLKEYKGPHVIKETAQAMNKMQQRIRDLIKDRTIMLAAISHDLKTPLTRLKLRAHLFDDETVIRQTLRDLDEMETMINELLDFSKDDHESERKGKLELNSFLQTICDDFSDMGYQASFNRAPKRIVIICRKLALKRAINNLIQNAVKYGKCAIVSLSVSRKDVTIIIEDKGPGIDEKEFENVFSPFYRLDQSRSRRIAGTGLGLAIAKRAIESHKGDIVLSNKTEGGLRVKVILPSRTP